mmetsp:Transcript_33142/g.80608  ORF Transcript_33142/g.80608 Transcript_33142/m.80608 type:complete len:168 (-) Transcript_33142:1605-2108(-)
MISIPAGRFQLMGCGVRHAQQRLNLSFCHDSRINCARHLPQASSPSLKKWRRSWTYTLIARPQNEKHSSSTASLHLTPPSQRNQPPEQVATSSFFIRPVTHITRIALGELGLSLMYAHYEQLGIRPLCGGAFVGHPPKLYDEARLRGVRRQLTPKLWKWHAHLDSEP